MFNLFSAAETKAIIVDKLVDQYDKIIEDQNKLEEVRASHQPLSDLEDNKKRMVTRVARENADLTFGIERVLEQNDLVDISSLVKIVQISRSVCRVLINSKPIGTGFLINQNILVTNNHVIPDTDTCANTKAEFFYETDEEGRILNPMQFKLEPETFFFTSNMKKKDDDEFSGLDFTMVALEQTNLKGQNIQDIPSLDLDGNIGKIIKGESCIIIQHPNGLPKKTTLNNNSFFSENKDQIIYETDTLPGSSGALVIGLGTCEAIALHQTGIPKMDDKGNPLTRSGTIATSQTPDEDVEWVGNAGIRISRILETLKKKTFPNDAQNAKKNEILSRTNKNKKELKKVVEDQPEISIIKPKPETPEIKDIDPKTTKEETEIPLNDEKLPFIILAKNTLENFENLESELILNYGRDFELYLATPVSAKEDEEELYVLNISSGKKNPNEFARELLAIKGILHAEYDSEIYLNMEVTDEDQFKSFESSDPEKGFNNEKDFLELYSKTSKYVKGKTESEYRQWNWKAVNYSGGIKDSIDNTIKIVQFDTGYSHHPKNYECFDLMNDYDFVDDDDNSREDENNKLISLADHGHGARTGSIIIGNQFSEAEGNGNWGFLRQNGIKLIPYRVAKDVLLIGRQSELAKAVDAAIAADAKVITTSMGLPPTMTTYNLAKKVYEKGIIWCCAAGNEVKEVVAPAVHPGTIAVAASNPNDMEWKGSSRGKTVDITAPGMHVYVPKFLKERSGLFRYGMAYGHGTSYATPHVSSAAVLWLHKNRQKLSTYHGYQIVEAFRVSLINSARTKHSLPSNFGAGILDIDQLLKSEVPETTSLENAYKNEDISKVAMGFRTVGESLKMIWNGIMRGIRKTITSEESLQTEDYEMSDHAKRMLEENTTFNRSSLESMVDKDQSLEVFNQLRQKVI
jgi:endonuclease G